MVLQYVDNSNQERARLICGNYCGISIGDTIGKVYAKVLGNRLKHGMDIDNCQAEGTEERGCIEHIQR